MEKLGKNLPLSLLSQKLVTLLALATGQRIQTLASLQLKNVFFSPTEARIRVTDLLKTSKPHAVGTTLVLPKFQERPLVCPVGTLEKYLAVTKVLRGTSSKLFLCTTRPFGPASTTTLSRWLRSFSFG